MSTLFVRTSHRRAGGLLLAAGGAAGLIVGLASPALAQPGDTTRVSTTSTGGQATLGTVTPAGLRGDSGSVDLSDDGRYVAFASFARNLVVGDTNDHADIFVKDRVTGLIVRVSLKTLGGGLTEATGGDSSHPRISGNGRFVVYASNATNLSHDPARPDDNNSTDIFVYDRDLSSNGIFDEFGDTQTTMLSVNENAGGGPGNNTSFDPDISRDGSRVAFRSAATNLDTDVPANGLEQIYVRPRTSRLLTMVSSRNGVAGNHRSTQPSLNANGSKVAFTTAATNLVGSTDLNGTKADILLRSVAVQDTVLVSQAFGAQADQLSREPSLFGDKVAFTSEATNFELGVGGPGKPQVYVRDVVANTTVRASTGDGIDPAAGDTSSHPSLAGCGCAVAFTTLRNGTNGRVFVRQLLGSITVRVDVSGSGAAANGNSTRAAFSNDGQAVGFDSLATNLVSGDTNGFGDAFVHEL